MDSTNDMIVGAAVNYSWEALRNYALSVHRSGFKGTKLLCVQDINAEARKNLTTLGFTLIDFRCKDGGAIAVERYVPVIDFLKNTESYRYVIWCDVRDLVVQTDPSPWLEKHLSPQKLLGCSEGLMIYDEATNVAWVKRASELDYEWVVQEELLCSGTIAGEATAMRDLMQKMYDMAIDPQFSGQDQALLNHVLRLSPFKEMSRIVRTDDAFALQAGWCMVRGHEGSRLGKDPRLDMASGLAYPDESDEPYCIVHQYDRDASGWLGNFTEEVNKHYYSAPEILGGLNEDTHSGRSGLYRLPSRTRTS